MGYTMGNVKPWVASAGNTLGPMFGIKTIYGYSYRAIEGTTTLSDHAYGLALDFMCGLTTGNALAAYAMQHASELHIQYIIHNRRIWNIGRASEGWRAYHGLNPHTDHVHISFKDQKNGMWVSPPSDVAAGGGSAPVPVTGSGGNSQAGAQSVLSVPDPLNPLNLPGYVAGGLEGLASGKNPITSTKDAITGTFGALTNIAKAVTFLMDPRNWIRVLLFMAGLFILGMGITMAIKEQDALRGAAQSTTQTVTSAVSKVKAVKASAS